MLNIYDILLNFQDSDRVYEFFEWNNDDEIEHIKKIPMIKVSSNFLDDILKYKIIIKDSNFTDKIYQKTEVFGHNKIGVIEYACLFTDGYKVVAVELNGDGKVLFKSFLLLDEEEEVLEYSNDIKYTSIEYKKVNQKVDELFLTREEEYRRNYLLRELKNAKKEKNNQKIDYLYEEIYPVDNKTEEEKYNILIEDISNNYRDCYNELFKILKLVHSKKKTTN